MAARPFRDASGQTATVYWRRRVAVLLVGFSVLAGVSWAAAAGVESLVRPDGTATGRDGSAAMSPGGSAGPLERRASLAQVGVADATSATRAASAGRPAARAGGSLKTCPAGDVVLTLIDSAPSYPVQLLSEFTVDVASTAGYSCTFDIGARHVVLQISAGTAAVWTSAECAEGPAIQLATLHRGVPTVVPMTWDDEYSSAGCPVPGRTAPAGRYTAKATAGSVASNSVAFRIG
jgi:hypothetical protein